MFKSVLINLTAKRKQALEEADAALNMQKSKKRKNEELATTT